MHASIIYQQNESLDVSRVPFLLKRTNIENIVAKNVLRMEIVAQYNVHNTSDQNSQKENCYLICKFGLEDPEMVLPSNILLGRNTYSLSNLCFFLFSPFETGSKLKSMASSFVTDIGFQDPKKSCPNSSSV